MIFKPRDTKLWDTFILAHEGRFYLYYLSSTRHFWDGYGLAVSEDLLHWKDHGVFLACTEGGMGTGMVWRAGNRWLLNYSLDQNIHFAESNDLMTWRKLPKEIVSRPDPRWYETDTAHASGSRRWDTICVEPDPDGDGFVGFITASANNGPPGGNGVCGFLRSHDGLRWEAGPPASAPCGIPWAEVGGHVSFGENHYLLVSSSTGIGARFGSVEPVVGKSAGCFVMHARKIEGPYTLASGDPLLLGSRCGLPIWGYTPAYFLRPLSGTGETLVNHHWMPRASFVDAWLGTPKVLREEKPGTLALAYWTGCEKLKGKLLFDLADPPGFLAPNPQPIPAARWEVKPGSVRGTTTASGVLRFDRDLPVSDGLVIEAELSMDGEGAAGFWFPDATTNEQNPYPGAACLANMRGVCEFGTVASGPCSPPFYREEFVPWTPVRKSMKWRILLRSEFIEWYINDRLIGCHGFSRIPAGPLGIYAERCRVALTHLKVWRFG